MCVIGFIMRRNMFLMFCETAMGAQISQNMP